MLGSVGGAPPSMWKRVRHDGHRDGIFRLTSTLWSARQMGSLIPMTRVPSRLGSLIRAAGVRGHEGLSGS
jgi:hypothetical protein